MNKHADKAMNKFTTWLFNPFHYIAGGTTLAIGLALMAITAVVAPMLEITFHATLQIGIQSFGFLSELSRQFVLIITMTALLWVAGKLMSTTDFRVLDLASTQMVARLPVQVFGMVMYSIPAVNEAMHSVVTRNETGQIVLNPAPEYQLYLLLNGLLGLLFMAWTVVLMYQSFAVSCNVKGGKAIGVFAFLLIVGHVLSATLNQLIHVLVFR